MWPCPICRLAVDNGATTCPRCGAARDAGPKVAHSPLPSPGPPTLASVARGGLAELADLAAFARDIRPVILTIPVLAAFGAAGYWAAGDVGAVAGVLLAFVAAIAVAAWNVS